VFDWLRRDAGKEVGRMLLASIARTYNVNIFYGVVFLSRVNGNMVVRPI
jgi:hypothetical protein